jgi:hypothetical protein
VSTPAAVVASRGGSTLVGALQAPHGPALPALATVSPPAPYAYAGVGLCLAPVFPTGLPRPNAAAPRARRRGAIVLAASMLGAAAAGPALGKAVERFGLRAVPLLLGAVSALCLPATPCPIRATRSHPPSP